ncbi:MAG: TlpA family protein disulfide reductase [Spirochaeta sp.]|nr:TlpA family protein disulfide reductase [Spirochaeta sp.]
MTIPDAIVLGPFALSFRLLVPLLSFVLAALLGRVVLRQEPDLRRSVFDTLTNGVLLFFLGWKLTPLLGLLFRNPEHVLSDPLIALYIPGGRVGAVVGLVLVAAYLGGLFLRRRKQVLKIVAPIVLIGATTLVLSAVAGLGIEIIRTVGGDVGAGRLTAVELDGTELPLYPRAGKPVVLNFWATWCGPCRAENDVKSRLAEAYGDEIELIGVNLIGTEAGRDAVAAYAEQWELTFPIVLDHGGHVAGAYAVRGTPTTVFINAESNVVERVFGAMSYGQAERIIRSMLP